MQKAQLSLRENGRRQKRKRARAYEDTRYRQNKRVRSKNMDIKTGKDQRKESQIDGYRMRE